MKNVALYELVEKNREHHHVNYYQPLIIVWALFTGGSYYLGFTPLLLSLVILVASTRAWRVSENTRHLIAFCGG